MIELKLNDVVEVEWLDIITKAEWLSEEKAKSYQLPLCRSVGYFLTQDKTCFRLSHSVGADDKERDVTVIPIGTIKKIKLLQRSQ